MQNQMSDLGQYIYLGKVMEVFPETYTATVSVLASGEGSFGHLIECKVIALKITGYGAASVSLPLPQDIVYVSSQFSETTPSIVGYATPPRSHTDTNDYHTTLTPLKINNDNFEEGSNNIRGNSPPDVLPGDDFKTGDDGQTLAILAGGSVIAKATALCQLILTKTRATALLVARRLKIFTDFGEITSDSENGQASLKIKGGSHVKQNNKQNKHDTEIILGGQHSFQAKLPNNFSLNIDKAGNVAQYSTSSLANIQNDSTVLVRKDQNTSILGSKTTNIGNHSHNTVGGNYKQTVDGSDTLITLGSSSKVVNGANRVTTNSVSIENVSGINAVATSPTAKHTSIGAGDYLIEVGSLSLKSIPPPILAPKTGSFYVNVLNGDVQHETFLGDIISKTKLGDLSFSTIKGNIQNSTLLGNFNASATTGVNLTTTAGTANLESTAGPVVAKGLTATVEASTQAEMKAAKAMLSANVRLLNGDSSTDSVVTALKLTAQIQSKILAIFNSHTHVASGAPSPTPTSPPTSVMQPIQPNSIVNNKKTLG